MAQFPFDFELTTTPIPTELTPYSSVISTGFYPILTILFTIVGVFIMSWFFIYEVTSGADKRRNLFKELLLALLAAVFLGFGTLFLLLWAGVFV